MIKFRYTWWEAKTHQPYLLIHCTALTAMQRIIPSDSHSALHFWLTSRIFVYCICGLWAHNRNENQTSLAIDSTPFGLSNPRSLAQLQNALAPTARRECMLSARAESPISPVGVAMHQSVSASSGGASFSLAKRWHARAPAGCNGKKANHAAAASEQSATVDVVS